MMNQPRREKNLFSGNLADEGTDAEMFGGITKPESGTRRSPCHEMRSQRWERLPMSECTEKGVTLVTAIIDKLRTESESKLNKALGYDERTLSSLET